MSELVLKVLLVIMVASTVAGNASLVIYVWYLYKQDQHSAELAERLRAEHAELAERLLEGEDDETTD